MPNSPKPAAKVAAKTVSSKSLTAQADELLKKAAKPAAKKTATAAAAPAKKAGRPA